jgi:hypothetical protein
VCSSDLDDIHRREKTVELTLDRSFSLAAHTLRHLGGVSHETRKIVQHPVWCHNSLHFTRAYTIGSPGRRLILAAGESSIPQ